MGRAIREHRVAAGLSQLDVAQAWGCDRSNVSHIEAGRQPASVEQLRAFAELVGKDIGELLRDAA